MGPRSQQLWPCWLSEDITFKWNVSALWRDHQAWEGIPAGKVVATCLSVLSEQVGTCFISKHPGQTTDAMWSSPASKMWAFWISGTRSWRKLDLRVPQECLLTASHSHRRLRDQALYGRQDEEGRWMSAKEWFSDKRVSWEYKMVQPPWEIVWQLLKGNRVY